MEVISTTNDGSREKRTVTERKWDKDGLPTGVPHSNPLLDTTMWEVTFVDGTIQDYSTNVIAESLYFYLNDDGHEGQLLSHIVDHHSDNSAFLEEDTYVITPSGNKHRKKTKKGWFLCIEWLDGSTIYEILADFE